MKNKSLLKYALEALNNSYSPYSNYKVGAAILLKNGKMINTLELNQEIMIMSGLIFQTLNVL